MAAVVGPTAGGKTALAVRLAEKLNGEIVSCDSMQLYRGMDIGTAKPDEAERRGIPHHLIDIADPRETFSCADYVRAAREVISDIHARNRLPVLCGGTGLYLDSLLRGSDFEETAVNPALRERWKAFAAEKGAHALYERLIQVDPESAAAIHENNVRRVIRALEIYESTGMTKSEADRKSRTAESPYLATVIGLKFNDRSLLYRRIDRRVEEMFRAGLAEETTRLRLAGVFESNNTAAQAIGYKELFGYLDGTESAEQAAEKLKTATRHYAKRQMTWFSAKEYVRWISADRDGAVRSVEELCNEAVEMIQG